MTVLSKFFQEIMPKSVTGWVLCMVPIAAVVIAIMFPQAIVEALMPAGPSEEELLIEEDTVEGVKVAIEDGKKKKRRNLRGNKPVQKRETIKVADSANIQTAEEEPVESFSLAEDESLLRLASIQNKALSPPPSASRTGSVPRSPVFSALSLSNEGENDDAGTKWSRVPTKQEETIASLKNRAANLAQQLEEREKEATELRSKLEKEQARTVEAENELKDRSRSYQIRWVEMENEISNLKTARDQLMTRLSESLSAQDVTLKQRDDTIATLKEKVEALGTNSTNVIQLQERLVEREKIETELNGRLTRLEEELKKEKASVEERQGQWGKELSMLQGEKKTAQVEMDSLKEQLARTTSLLESTTKQATDLQANVEDKDNELAKLREEGQHRLSPLEDEVDKLSEALKERENEVSVLTSSLQSLKEERGALEAQIARGKEGTTELQEQIAKLKQDLAEMEEQRSGLAKQVAMAPAKEAQIVQLSAELKLALDEREQLGDKLKGIEAHTRELEEKQAQERTAHEVAEQERIQLATEISNLRSEVVKLCSDLQEANDQLTKVATTKESVDLEEKVKKLQDSLEASQSERFELAAQMEQTDQALKQAKTELSKAEKKYHVLQGVAEMKQKDYKDEIKALQDERDRLISKLADFAQSTEMIDRLVTESSTSAEPLIPEDRKEGIVDISGEEIKEELLGEVRGEPSPVASPSPESQLAVPEMVASPPN